MTLQPPTELRRKIPWWVWDSIADETPLRTLCISGGLGSGKSHGGGIWDLQRVQQNGTTMADPKPTKSWTVAPNYRICETLLELTFQVALDVFELREGKHYTLRRSFPRVLDFSPMKLRHQMFFLSAENPEHFVSDSITHWRWSEVGVSKALVFEKLGDRLRDPRAKVLQGLAEGTPEGINHWADIADIPGVGRDRVDAEKNRRRFIVETGDNAANLTPGYVQALRDRYAYDPAKLISYEKGLFVPFNKSSAYYEFVESRNVVAPIEPRPEIPVYFCWDFNVSPLAWVAAQKFWTQEKYYSPRREKVIALKEASGESRGLLDAVAEFAATFPVSQYRDTLIEVHGDASGWAKSHKGNTASDYMNIEDYLRGLGYRNISIQSLRSNPIVRQRLEKVAALMAYEYTAVTSECKKLITGFRKTSLKEGTWDIEKPQGEDWTHFPDAFTYGLFKLYKNTDVVNPGSKVVGTAF